MNYFIIPHKIFLKYNFGGNIKCNNLSLLSMHVVRSITDKERFFWEISIPETLMETSRKQYVHH